MAMETVRQMLPPRLMPRWDGSPLSGRSILLRSEQGAGDVIQFIRYGAKLKQAGAGRVALEIPNRLHWLLKSCAGIDLLISRTDDADGFELQAPLASLPGLFRTNFRTIPAAVSYLGAEPDRVERWRSRLPQARLRIGVAWQGNRDYPEDHLRSIPLAAFEPLACLPDTVLVSLQLGDGMDQIEPLRERVPLWQPGPDLDADAAFVDTAAIMMSLNLIVTADTSIAHLAGAGPAGMDRPGLLARMALVPGPR